ncbi:MAG: T9SS type A sorting domain-containing protein [Bacteroidia bacterium]
MGKIILPLLIGILTLEGAKAQSTESITIDIGSTDISDSVNKPHMLGVIAGPLPNYQSTAPDLTSSYQNIGVTTIRNNDYFDDRLDMERMFFCGTYPINSFTPQYPKWDCDPNDTNNYHFVESDIQFQNWVDGGFLPFFRLGGENSHPIRPHDYEGPRSGEEGNWIKASLKVTNRYNNFGGKSNTLNGYLNIWTEYPQKNFWDRDSLSFTNFWCNAYDSLNNHFPSLKIGGPGFNSSVSIQVGNSLNGNISPHIDLFLRELKSRNLKPGWIGFHVFSNDINDFYKTALAYRKLLRAEQPFANTYAPVWGDGNNSFFNGVELICDAWGFDNDQTLPATTRDSLFNKQRGAAHHTGVFIALQQADIERAYIYRGGEFSSGTGSGIMGLFYGDVNGTYKPAAYGFKLCSKMQTQYTKKLLSPVYDTASGGSVIWTLAGMDTNGNRAILISNPSASTINLTLTLNSVNLSTTLYPNVNLYSVTDLDSGQTPHPWTNGAFILAPYSAHLITMSTGSTGINELVINQPVLTLFPNPFSTETIIRSDTEFKNASLVLYNSYGKEVRNISNVSGNEIKIQRNMLPGGLYFIRLTQDNKITLTTTLVITD